MTAPFNPELFTRELVDTRKPGGDGSGMILELTRDKQLRVIVIVNWPNSGLLAQYDTLSAEQTRELRNRLAQALPPMLADLVPPGERGPDRLFTAETPPAGELHAKGDRALHAHDRDVRTAEPWNNPFAPDDDDDQAAT